MFWDLKNSPYICRKTKHHLNTLFTSNPAINFINLEYFSSLAFLLSLASADVFEDFCFRLFTSVHINYFKTYDKIKTLRQSAPLSRKTTLSKPSFFLPLSHSEKESTLKQ